MAVYRLSASIVSRSAGRSVLAAAAYRAADILAEQGHAFSQALAAAAYRAGASLSQDGEGGDREGRGLVHDYSRKQGVVHSEILVPAGAPVWMRDRERLWNAVEAGEKRKDAQLARELQLALPRELDRKQQIALVRSFARAQLVARGMVVDLALHDTRARDGERQPHAHLLLTMRGLDPDSRTGFAAKKEIAWNSKDLLRSWRASWAEHVNQALAQAQQPERVDHRSLEAQRQEALARGDWQRAAALDREPEPKLGPGTLQLERQGEVTERGEIWRAAQDRNALRREVYELVDGFGAKARGPFLELRERLGGALDAFLAWSGYAYQQARDWLQERLQPPLERAGDRLRAWAASLDRDSLAQCAASLQQIDTGSLAPIEAAGQRALLAELARANFDVLDQTKARIEERERQREEARMAEERQQQTTVERQQQTTVEPENSHSTPAAKEPSRERESQQAGEVERSRERDLDLDLGY